MHTQHGHSSQIYSKLRVSIIKWTLYHSVICWCLVSFFSNLYGMSIQVYIISWRAIWTECFKRWFADMCVKKKHQWNYWFWWCTKTENAIAFTWWRHQMETFSALLALMRGIHRWSSLTKTSDAKLWYFLWCAPEQTVEQTAEMPVIWDAIALIVSSLQCILYPWNITLQWGRSDAICGMLYLNRAHSRFAPSQWETSLQSNAVSYRLGANLESALP